MVLNLQQLFIPFVNKSDEKLFAIKKSCVKTYDYLIKKNHAVNLSID